MDPIVKAQKYFYEEIVLGFGFLSGIWIAVGIDPEAIVFDSLLNLIKVYAPDFSFGWIFHIIPIIIIICSIIEAKRIGGNTGLIGVSFAFVAGCLILRLPIIGILLIIFAMYIGNSGVKQELNRSI